ncbi:ABC transporter ATP-binding protein [candidate division KSB1 bacterium]|nr:ABC transporter ATP-binding protein [candidate division KSB1 bacterium]
MPDLELKQVSFSYEDAGATVRGVRDVSLRLQRGESYLICGPSGSGKSTLSMLLAGLLSAQSGSIAWADSLALTRPVAAYVFQFPEQLFFADSVRDEFREVAANADPRDIERILTEFGLKDPELLDRNPYLLSMGFARLTALALQAARNPDLLIVDEPTIGLDDNHASRITRFLRDWVTIRRILVTVTHEIELIRSIGGTCLVMSEGALAWSGPHTELLQDPLRMREFGLSE